MSRPRPLLLAVLLSLTASGALAQTPAITTTPLVAPSQAVPVVKPPPGAKPHRPAHPKPAHAKPAQPKPNAAVKPAAKAKPPPPAPQTAPPAAAPAPPKLDPTKGTTTGLKLPRWVSFRSDEVNLRTGPGMQYPIDWQYHRRDLPVRVLREFEVWRLVELQDGTKGWVHQATLTGRRGFLVLDGQKVLRASPDAASDAVARLEPGVVGHIRTCEAGHDWCEVQTGEYRGWLRRADVWGVDPDEAVN